MASLGPPPILPAVAASGCPANSGYTLCFDAPAADALKRRLILLKSDSVRCRAAHDKAAER